jgi:hypothetical protein
MLEDVGGNRKKHDVQDDQQQERRRQRLDQLVGEGSKSALGFGHNRSPAVNSTAKARVTMA